MRTEHFMYFFVLRIMSGPRVKFVQLNSFNPPPPPVVYIIERSKAVVPMLFLFCVAL